MDSIADVSAFLDADFASSVATRGVPGAAIAVLKDGEVYEHAAGVLSTATGVEATTDSVFQIGSITKVWTATLVMQLVDEGLLDLDAPLRDYLPQFRIADEAAAMAITTRHLLSHQAGFEGDIFTDTGRGDDAIEKYLAELADTPQVFAPGEMFAYNNAGYAILGRLIEVLRDKPWEPALVDHLVTPLGLTHVAPSAYEAVLHRAAVGHLGTGDDSGSLTAAPVWALSKSTEAAGSMLAMRPRDLLAFAAMHLAGGVAADGTRVVSEESVAAMQQLQSVRTRTADGRDTRGLGWGIYPVDGGQAIGHDGGTIGQVSFLRVIPGAGTAVALVTNGGDSVGLFTDMVKRIVKDATGIELPGGPVPPAEPVDIDLEPLLGFYSNSTTDVTVRTDNDGRTHADVVPKGALVEAGATPQHCELIPFSEGALITAEPGPMGIHTVYSFLGDGGSGRAKYVHMGRAVPRAD